MSRKNKKEQRLGEEKYNNQGCLMKIVEYNNALDILIEFQDEYKTKMYTTYRCFLMGEIKNPYIPSVYNVGIIGTKYPAKINGKQVVEYKAWQHMLERCFDEKYKNKYQTYEKAICCEEWLLYENFYEWLHGQDNFDKWYNGKQWCLDKDILIKGNKTYSPEACCLVPQNINKLFLKSNSSRGNFPIGVCKEKDKFVAFCCNPFIEKQKNLGYFSTPEQAFQKYKNYKENIIKQVAQEEYNKNNITKQCYEAMMKYEVEIVD